MCAGACRVTQPPDIRDPAPPSGSPEGAPRTSRTESATFNNDASSALTMMGRGAPARDAGDRQADLGADAIYSSPTASSHRELLQDARLADRQENCGPHNGSLIPCPGSRTSWCRRVTQGGIALVNFTDASHPVEIASSTAARSRWTSPVLGGALGPVLVNSPVASEIAPAGWTCQSEARPALSKNDIAAADLANGPFNPSSSRSWSCRRSFCRARRYLASCEGTRAEAQLDHRATSALRRGVRLGRSSRRR